VKSAIVCYGTAFAAILATVVIGAGVGVGKQTINSGGPILVFEVLPKIFLSLNNNHL
jgi:SNF family Na+-dependent transporter